jgi:hypothetical protein
MKIEQKKNTKRPLYATGTALLASTMILSGCSLMNTTETTEIQLSGEMNVTEDYGNNTLPTVNGYQYDIPRYQEDGRNFDRGWYIRDVEGEKFVLVCGGEFEIEGGIYYIRVTDVTYDPEDNAVVISVEDYIDTSVNLSGLYHPSCSVEFDKIPDKIRIESTNGGTYEFGGYILDTDEWGLDIDIDPDYTAVFDAGSELTYVYEMEDGKYRYINVGHWNGSKQHPDMKDFVKGSGTVDNVSELEEVCKRFRSFYRVRLKADEGTEINAEDYIKMLKEDEV